MALDFPNDPTLNQTYTSGGRSWKWNGISWQLDGIATSTVTGVPAGSGQAGQVLASDGAGGLVWVNLPVSINPDTNGNTTIPGNLTLNRALVETTHAISGTAPNLDPTNGSIQTWTLTGASSPLDAMQSGQTLTLMVTGNGFLITWPSISWKSQIGAAPTLNSSGVTAIMLWKVDSVLYGARVGDA
jgi:hypothetical protein